MILISKSPNICASVLNENASILIFKKFPKDYRGWVYLYCTKDNKKIWYYDKKWLGCYSKNASDFHDALEVSMHFPILNGKVVARFYCDKVEEIFINSETTHNEMGYDIDEMFETLTLKEYELCKKSCLTETQLFDYFSNRQINKLGYAIHISQLEIFDRPKELWEFEKYGSYNRPDIKCKNKDRGICNRGWGGLKGYIGCEKARLTKAPQNYCYVEELENAK